MKINEHMVVNVLVLIGVIMLLVVFDALQHYLLLVCILTNYEKYPFSVLFSIYLGTCDCLSNQYWWSANQTW